MSYATGSGDYTALMAAVLSFAIADGWTTTGGTWPISKGQVKGVDWSTFTQVEDDHTAGVSVTARYVRIAVGTTPANATTNAASSSTSAVCANMHYTFTNWWIFSDPSLGDYIHVVAQFSNTVNPDCYAHFSFGEMNKNGLSYTGIYYAAASPQRGYAAGTYSGNNARDWNAGPLCSVDRIFAGRIGWTYSSFRTFNSVVWISDSTASPFPSGANWPLDDTVNNTDRLKDAMTPATNAVNNDLTFYQSNSQYAASVIWNHPQPYSGSISMIPLPFMIMNGTGTTASLMMLGDFPNVRLSSLEGFADQDEVTFSSDTWKIFPLLRNTSFVGMTDSGNVSSGRTALAYKKVV
jgi:hypothetical protein